MDLGPERPIIDQFGDDGIKQTVAHYYAITAELWGAGPSLETYIGAHVHRTALIAAIQARFDQIPLLLTPVSVDIAAKNSEHR